MSDTKKVKRQLFDRLKDYYPDKDFVGGLISNVKNDEDRLKIIDYMDSGEDISVENIILFALDLNLKRKGDKEEWEELVKQAYLVYEDEPTYIKAYKWNDSYIVHGRKLVCGIIDVLLYEKKKRLIRRVGRSYEL